MVAVVQPEITYLKDYQVPTFLIKEVFLHFELFEDHTTVKTLIDFYRNPESNDQSSQLTLAGEDLELVSIALNGKTLSNDQYRVDEHSLTLLQVPDTFKLETEVIIHPEHNTQLSGLYKSSGNFCTQCEAEGFRRITYFLDRPDVLTKYTTTISADKNKYPYLLSNGNLLEEKTLADNRHWVMWQDPFPKPSYLFALVAGDFDVLEDHFHTMSSRDVLLRLYVEKGMGERGHYAIQALKDAMRWDEEVYGREYDLDIYMIVAVSDFNMGAMENKGLNIFNTRCVLADPKTATDDDYFYIQKVIGHEYFHNWSGNRVTCRDWFQLTLKEGLTVFRDQHFSRDMTDSVIARIDEVNVLRNQQFAEDAGPMAHPIQPKQFATINNFYTTTVYRKGAEIIRMIRTILGQEQFRQAMDLYFERHDGQAVTTEDFVQAMIDASGVDLSQFKRWYDQPGTPLLEMHGDYDALQQTYTLHITQSNPKHGAQDEPLHIPIAIGMIDEKGNPLPMQLANESQAVADQHILHVNQAQQTFTFINLKKRPLISLLRDFSAPVKLNFDYSDQDLISLAHFDHDAFNRWNALQQYFVNVIKRAVVSKNLKPQLDAQLFEALQALMTQEQDLNLLSRMLMLPSEHQLLEYLPRPVDIESLVTVRHHVRDQLAQQLQTSFYDLYQRHQAQQAYVYTVSEMGRRSVERIALAYLVATNEQRFAKLAYEHLTHADNLTDQVAALASLNHYTDDLREQAFQYFYQQWQHEPLVMCKWLSLQALSHVSGALERVQRIMHDRVFDINNPNRVQALLGSFAMNLPAFHAQDGCGYEFLATHVIAIDKKNPQLASRVLIPLIHWHKFDCKRQALMKTALQKIAAQPKLSADVHELVAMGLRHK